ncbi:MAG: hypothetical protein ACYSUT_10715 [Planctomycetota bacterium]|jgi:hypothetical protein
MKLMFKDIISFFKSHWPHLIVAIPAAVAFTAIHELAHCVAVWVQGGHVTSFVWLPSGTKWGYMRYSFPIGTEYSSTAISLSPYVFWFSFCLLAGILSLRRTAWPFWIASIIYVWLFIVPLADIANTAAPYLLKNTNNDLQHAFGAARSSYALITVVVGIAVAIFGFLLNKRLYRDRSIGFPAYCVLATIATLVILAISV